MLHDSRFVFFGTPEFAAIVLEKLIHRGYIPNAVVCNPDRPVGRKKIIMAPPAKMRIENQEARIRHQIQILQPENISLIHDSLFMLHPDFFIVAAYAKILSKEILEIPRLGAIGVHPSLLPKYRGPSPIQSAILNGDEKTGVALYLLDEKMDHGPILATGNRELATGVSYETLLKELAELGGDLLVETLPKFLNGKIKPRPQDESKATYTKKFERKDAYVDQEDLREAEQGSSPQKAAEIDRKIRAFNQEPGAWTIQNGKQIKLLEAETRNGKLLLKKIQKEGEKPKQPNF